MSTLTLRPNATGTATVNPHDLSGDSANWRCVDEAVSDDDTTYLLNLNGSTVSATARDIMNLANPTSGLLGTINSVTVTVRARYEAFGSTTPTIATVLQTGSTNYVGATVDLIFPWADYSTAYTLNPNTGIAWTWADITALKVGVESITTEIDDELHVTQVWATVDYNEVYQPSSTATMTIVAGQPSFVLGSAAGMPARLSAALTLANSQSVVKSLSRSSTFALDLSESNSITGDF